MSDFFVYFSIFNAKDLRRVINLDVNMVSSS